MLLEGVNVSEGSIYLGNEERGVLGERGEVERLGNREEESVKEQIIFPEINYDDVKDFRGMDIVICTSARTNEEALELIKGFELPFKGMGA